MFFHKIIAVLLVIHSTYVAFAQQSVVVNERDDAQLYMASIMHLNSTDSLVRPYIGCAGVFIKENHVLTAASCVHEFIKEPMTPNLRFSSGSTIANLVGGPGTPHSARQIHVHPRFNPQNPLEHNIAVVEVDHQIRRDEVLQPRDFNEIQPNRFCTMMGWEGHTLGALINSLQMFAVPIVNSTFCSGNVYCTRGEMTSSTVNCGGLRGAPVFCGGGKVSGIVVQDNFCQGSKPVGGSFISVEDYRDWIEQVTSAATKTSLALFSFFIAIFVKFST
jgi:secreted trypsin-like serine protease